MSLPACRRLLTGQSFKRHCRITSSRAQSRCTRSSSTSAHATTGSADHDPDTLLTQDPSLNPSPESLAASVLNKATPRPRYTPPPLGTNAAYDLALKYLQEERQESQRRLRNATSQLKRLEGKRDEKSAEKRKELEAKVEQWSVLSEINDPEVQWKAAHGEFDYELAVYRHLAKKRWLGRPMLLTQQRIEQMHVIPDLLPKLTQEVDVRLGFPAPLSVDFETGGFLHSKQTEQEPSIRIQSFGKLEQTNYTIAIINLDVPDEAANSYSTYLHYLRTGVTLSPTQSLVEQDNGTVAVSWLPPHPYKGLPYQRYVTVVWREGPTTLTSGSSVPKREGFDARQYQASRELHPVGISFWRQIYDDNVPLLMRRFPEIAYQSKNYQRVQA
ncbi:mitochondrial 54S ribosomal protein YmL35 [Savitreella phatthalungensis]